MEIISLNVVLSRFRSLITTALASHQKCTILPSVLFRGLMRWRPENPGEAKTFTQTCWIKMLSAVSEVWLWFHDSMSKLCSGRRQINQEMWSIFLENHSLCLCRKFFEASHYRDFLRIISVTNKILCFCSLYSKDSGEHGDVTLSERGSVLVFLPGISEIRYMQEALSKLVHKRWASWPERMLHHHRFHHLTEMAEKGKWRETWGDAEMLVLLQVAGLSSPLHCHTGGAEQCVSEVGSWFQEGKNVIFLTLF